MHGNKCGHSPDNPRWFEPPKQHTRPKLIEKVIAEIRRYYSDPASSIPSLNLANGSDRQQRSERREACLAVLGCLLHYLDLATLRVGIPQNDASFQGITMSFIAGKAGLSLKRAERAIRDLVKAGLITVYPLCEKLGDTIYKGYAAIRTISAKLFTLFGLAGRLKFERDKASARLKKKTCKQETKNKAKIDLISSAASQSTPASANSARRSALRSIKDILNTT
ncbi:MAG: replication protein RepA [Methylomonas sp.]|nr:replication protein RepA [Methylomonas sp.]